VWVWINATGADGGKKGGDRDAISKSVLIRSRTRVVWGHVKFIDIRAVKRVFV
jgi:hypothetical protein